MENLKIFNFDDQKVITLLIDGEHIFGEKM